MSGRQPVRILLWIADTGGGHRAAAAAVAAALEDAAGDGVSVVIQGPEPETGWSLGRAPAALYGPIVRLAPALWGAGFHLTDSRSGAWALRGVTRSTLTGALAEGLARLRPAVAVSLHPLLVSPLAAAARRVAWSGPRATVVTDLARVHRSWVSAPVDLLCVPTAAAAAECRRQRATPIPIETGLPIAAPFSAVAPPGGEDRPALRRRLGLDPERFCVLLTGGGEGAGLRAQTVHALAEAELPIQLAVVCGRNRRLERTLQAVPFPVPVRVVGYVDAMADWLRAADVVIGKAGPATIAEAAAMGRPLLCSGHLPGQEGPNLALAVRAGFARPTPGPRAMLEAIAELSVAGSPALARMGTAARRWSRPDAAARVAAALLALAEPGGRG
ncbi:MAG TPA: glycosyltransferase [Candidatus Dormibacteraeota bacterium]|nr:glycosyltransferase [Candidatus Dormibacteraeota bacterium]